MTTESWRYNSDRPLDHPLEHLDAFALNALEPFEEEAVQDHLDACPACWGVVDSYQETASALAQAISLVAAPEALRPRVFNSLPAVTPAPLRANPILAGAVPAMPRPSLTSLFPDNFLGNFLGNRFVRLLMPATAALAIVLVIVAVSMNLQLAGRVSDMEQQNLALRNTLNSSNATTAAHFSEMADTGDETMSGIRQLRVASYAAAQPDNQSLLLKPTADGSQSQGILVLDPEGMAAVIMVSGMDANMTSGYQVWLERSGERQLVGNINVDSGGWGTVQLQLTEPVYMFDKVELTDPNDMVLEASLASAALPQRLVSLPIGR